MLLINNSDRGVKCLYSNLSNPKDISKPKDISPSHKNNILPDLIKVKNSHQTLDGISIELKRRKETISSINDDIITIPCSAFAGKKLIQPKKALKQNRMNILKSCEITR